MKKYFIKALPFYVLFVFIIIITIIVITALEIYSEVVILLQ